MWLYGCLALTLVLRLTWVMTVRVQQTADFAYYYEQAQSIAMLHGYTLDGHATAFQPVGYPLFLALLFRIFGASALLAKLANVLLGVGIVALAYLLTQWQFESRGIAGFTALLLAIGPNNIAYSSVLNNETLFTFLAMIGVWLICHCKQRLWPAVLAGFVLGCATLTRAAWFAACSHHIALDFQDTMAADGTIVVGNACRYAVCHCSLEHQELSSIPPSRASHHEFRYEFSDWQQSICHGKLSLGYAGSFISEWWYQ